MDRSYLGSSQVNSSGTLVVAEGVSGKLADRILCSPSLSELGIVAPCAHSKDLVLDEDGTAVSKRGRYGFVL